MHSDDEVREVADAETGEIAERVAMEYKPTAPDIIEAVMAMRDAQLARKIEALRAAGDAVGDKTYNEGIDRALAVVSQRAPRGGEDEPERGDDHEWRTSPHGIWQRCTRCGVVRRPDDANKPCRGDALGEEGGR